MLLTLTLLLTAFAANSESRLYPPPSEQTPEYWETMARQRMEASSRVWENLRYRAKNAILFIGDGMGVSTVTAGRILKGQVESKSSGEEAELEFDKFPHMGMSKTYNVDRQTPDSAGTATAFLCGVKANYGTVGVNQHAMYATCSSYRPSEHSAVSFLELAARQGKSVGVVTSTRITHATPAAAYAKAPSRDWESDTSRNNDGRSPDTPEQRRPCPDIATQLVDNAINFTVMLGGGRVKFLPKEMQTYDPVNGAMVNGERSDGVDLIARWKTRQQQAGRRALYVENTTQLVNLDPSLWDSLLGLMAARSHLQYDIDNQRSTGYKEPSLAEMTGAALKMLKKNENGFVLLVEGGRIDHGHHDNEAQRALYDVLALDKAVGVANRLTSEEDTLIAVTADHGHVFTLGHYAYRGQPVLERKMNSDGSGFVNGADGKPLTVLNYADGPGASHGARRNISNDDVGSKSDYRYQALVPLPWESHSGEDVGINARGPGAQLFHSVHEQSEIAHAFMKAVCLGWYASNGKCLTAPQVPTTTTADPNSAAVHRLSAAALATAAAACAVAHASLL